MIRKATHNDIPRILEFLSQVNDVHAEGRPDFFIKGKRKYDEEDLLKIINEIPHRFSSVKKMTTSKDMLSV